MQIDMMIRFTLRAVIALFAFSACSNYAEAQCTQGAGGPGSIQDAIQDAAASHVGGEIDAGTHSYGAPNVGSYITYDGMTWYLTASWFEANPSQGWDEDSVEAAYTEPGVGGGGGPGGGGHVNSGGCTILPEVVVTGITYGSGGGLLGFMGRMALGAPGGGRSQLWVNYRSVQANDSVTCASDYAAQEVAARDAIRPLGWLRMGTIIRVDYAPGSARLWVVTNPSATDRGLQPGSACRSS